MDGGRGGPGTMTQQGYARALLGILIYDLTLDLECVYGLLEGPFCAKGQRFGMCVSVLRGMYVERPVISHCCFCRERPRVYVYEKVN